MTTPAEELKAAIEETTHALAKLLKTASAGEIEAEDTLALEGVTRQALLDHVTDRLNAHELADNPHGITLDILNAYSKEEILSKSGEGVPSGLLPVSFYGSFNSDTIECTFSDFVLTLPAVGCYIQGTSFNIPSTQLSLAAYPYTKKVYIYLRYNNGVLSYFASTVYHAESPTVMYIGYVKNGFSEIEEAHITSVYRLGVYRVSEVPCGSALICSGGYPRSEDAVLDKGWFN